MYILTHTSEKVHAQTTCTLHAFCWLGIFTQHSSILHPFAFVWLGSYDTHECTAVLFTLFVSCAQIVLQGSDIEETSPCPGEQQYSGTRWLLLSNDWSWSFLCSYLWQLSEDAGHPDEIPVPIQCLLIGCEMLACFWCLFYVHRCGIPVVIMGETGCGKTRLVRYMCQLQARLNLDPSVPTFEQPQNFFIMKVRFKLSTELP